MMHKCIFALILVLCLCLAGCDGTVSTTSDATHPSLDDETHGVPDLGIDVDFEVLGSVALHHTVNISRAKYITSAAALPDNEELSEYNDSWFEDHALLLIYESVGSGNVKVDVEKITLDGATANITLIHTPVGTLGTGVKVTWLLWLEVEKGLQYTWQVENPSLESNISAQ